MGNNVANIGTTGGASNTNNGVFQINERLTWLKGRHTLKFGGSWNHYVDGALLRRQQRPARVHRLQRHSSPGAAFGDFLLDQVSSKGRGSLTDAWTHLQDRIAFYVADDYKITDNLTLNLGLRWGYTSPLVEKDDRAGELST